MKIASRPFRLPMLVLFFLLMFQCQGSRVFYARNVQYYKYRIKVEQSASALSEAMSQAGLSLEWQKWYFRQRAAYVRAQGNTDAADVYERFAMSLGISPGRQIPIEEQKRLDEEELRNLDDDEREAISRGASKYASINAKPAKRRDGTAAKALAGEVAGGRLPR